MARQETAAPSTWALERAKIDANFNELYRRKGFYDYDDAGTEASPIALSVLDQWYSLSNDTLGPNTRKTKALDGIPDVWNAAGRYFDFSGMSVDDLVQIRVDVGFITTGPNRVISLRLLVGPPGSQFTIPILTSEQFDKAISNPANGRETEVVSFYLGPTLQPHPVYVQAKCSSHTDTEVVVFGWFTVCERLF